MASSPVEGFPGSLTVLARMAAFYDLLGGDAVGEELGGERGSVGVSSSSWTEPALPLVESQATDGGFEVSFRWALLRWL